MAAALALAVSTTDVKPSVSQDGFVATFMPENHDYLSINIFSDDGQPLDLNLEYPEDGDSAADSVSTGGVNPRNQGDESSGVNIKIEENITDLKRCNIAWSGNAPPAKPSPSVVEANQIIGVASSSRTSTVPFVPPPTYSGMGPISGFLSCTTEMGQAGPSRLQPSACRSVTQQAHSIAPTATTNVSTQRSWFAASTATTYAIPRHQPYSRSLPYAEDAVLELRQKYPARQWPAVRQAGDNFLAAELAIVTQSHRPGQLSGIFQAEAGSSFVSAASTADTMVDKYTREYQQQLYTSSAMHLGQCYGTTSAAAALSASLPHALGAANAGSYNHDMRWKLQLGSHWAATPRTGHSFSTVGSSSLAIATPPNTTFASTLGVNPVRDVPRKQLEVRWPTILQTGNDFAASASSSSSISPSGLNTTSFANLLNVNPMPKARQLSPVSTFAAGMKLPTNDKLTNTPKKEKAPNPNKGVNSEYGEIPGYPVGALFEGRVKCCHAKVHRLTMGGIHRGPDGAYSIVLSGVYGDDVDKGEEILYTGTNGGGYAKDGKTGKVDQSFDNPSNASLAVNIRTGKPVRVVRRIKSYQSNSSKPTYRYDGLYKVVKAYMDVGIKGNMICRFELKRLEGQPPLPTTGAQL